MKSHVFYHISGSNGIVKCFSKILSFIKLRDEVLLGLDIIKHSLGRGSILIGYRYHFWVGSTRSSQPFFLINSLSRRTGDLEALVQGEILGMNGD